MSRLFHFFSIYCCLLFAVTISSFDGLTTVFASQQGNETSELTALLAEVEAVDDKVQSFHCLFVQEKILALFDKPVVFKGELTVERPAQLRWEFVSPIPSVLIFNSDKGVRCNGNEPPMHFNLSSDPVLKSVAEQLWLWLGGDYQSLKKSYHLKRKAALVLAITPKDEAIKKFIQSITITFNPETKQPYKVEISEAGGDRTRLQFSNYSLNPPVDEIVFNKCDKDE